MPTNKKKRDVKSFLVEVDGLHCNVINDDFNDYEMIGLLKVLLKAYVDRFGQGGGSHDEENDTRE